MRALATIVAALAALSGPVALAALGERIFAPIGGVSVEQPDGWQLVPPDQSLTNLKTFDFEDPRVQRTLAAPLITLRRQPEEIGGLLPTIKVNYVAYPTVGHRGAVGATEDIIGMLRSAYIDLEVLEAPRAETIAGRPSARAQVACSVRQGGKVRQGEIEMIVIPRGNLGIYTLGFSYPAGQAAQNRAGFETVRTSLRIDAK